MTPGALLQPYNTISRFRVPVSTAGKLCPEHEIHDVTSEDLDQIYRAINLLKSYGWFIGCDGELLAPRWIMEGM